MMYWIILIVLAVLILVTIIVTIVTIAKERKEYKSYELDDEYGIDNEDDYDDEGEDDYDKRPAKKRKKASSDKQPAPVIEKRRWKVILENPDTDERYSFIFYDTLGIGRTTKEVAFEQFLSLPDDKRISKVHCAIIRSKDKLYLRDEGSKNHTYLNGKKVQKPILIQKEDMISVGATDLEVVKILRETN